MLLDFSLYQTQYNFITDPARYGALITGAGYGKTHTGVVRAIANSISIPDAIGIVVAPTYTQLHDSTKLTFNRLCPRDLVAHEKNGNDGEETWLYNAHGGISKILWRSAHRPDSIRGLSCHWFWGDEAALFDEEVFLILMERLRLGDESTQHGWITSTPQGHNWVYDLFGIDQWGKRVNPDPDYAIYQAETSENYKGLSKGFIRSVYNRFAGAFADQELRGKFVGLQGLVYGDVYNPDIHVVQHWTDVEKGITGRELYNPSLPVDLAWDFGYPRPEAVLAIQQDAFGNVYIVDEVYHLKTLTEVIAAEVKEREWFPRVRDCLCDSARPDGIKRLQELKIPARPAEKGRIQDGIKLVRETFSLNPQTQQPRLLISSRCENLLTELKKYRWKDRKSESNEWKEDPIDEYNHALDAFRYWVMNKWRRPRERTEKKPQPRRVMGYQLL